MSHCTYTLAAAGMFGYGAIWLSTGASTITLIGAPVALPVFAGVFALVFVAALAARKGLTRATATESVMSVDVRPNRRREPPVLVLDTMYFAFC